jgi:hypothetical protein
MLNKVHRKGVTFCRAATTITPRISLVKIIGYSSPLSYSGYRDAARGFDEEIELLPVRNKNKFHAGLWLTDPKVIVAVRPHRRGV